MLGSKPTRTLRTPLAIWIACLAVATSSPKTADADVATPGAAAAPGGAEPPDPGPRKAPPAAPPQAAEVAEALGELARWVEGRKGSLSAHVIDSASGATWAAERPDLALNPASNMKILTAAVALDRLGPDYAFSTGLYGSAADRRVETLVLRGHGDPSLSTGDLWQLARALEKLGVKQVGRVLVDQSRFDQSFVPPAFDQQPDEWARFRAPVSAVALDGNAVTLNVLPRSRGQSADVWFEPAGVVKILGQVDTRKPGTGQAIRLDLSPDDDGQLEAKVGGHVAEGMPRLRFDKRMDDPRRAPGLALAHALGELGIEVKGKVALGGEEIEERLVFHRSEPLCQLVHALGKHSDNFYAETLLKVLGAEAGHVPARSEDGARVVREWLKEIGAEDPETRVENGSGLFDANRLSARTLTRVLTASAQNPRVYPELAASLSIAGVDGTLRSRLEHLESSRNVRAKTGTLARVISLSGYVLRSGGRGPLAFSFLVNGIEGHAWAIRKRVDRVVERLATAAENAP